MSVVSKIWPSSSHYAVYSGSGFTNPTNVAANDGTNATAGNGNGERWGYWGFDADIPSGATINTVTIEYKFQVAGAGTATITARARIGGVDEDAHTDSTKPASYKVVTVDITADRTWTRANLLDGTFEFVVSFVSGGGAVCGVDYIKVSVDYTLSQTLGVGKVASPSAVRGAALSVISGLPLSVGKITHPDQVRGVDMTLSGQIITAGKIATSAAVLGVSVTKEGDPWPTPHCEIDLGAPLGGSGWVSVIDSLVAIETNRARNFELDRYDTGTATLTFDNSDRFWDPLWSGSPLYPDLKPLRRMRFWTNFRGVTNYHFTGFILSIEPTVSAFDGTAQVKIQLVDGMEILANWPMATPIPSFTAQGGGGRVLLEAIGPRLGGGISVSFDDPYAGQHVSAPASMDFDGNSMVFHARRSQVSADDWDSFLDANELTRLLSGSSYTSTLFRATLQAPGAIFPGQPGSFSSGWPAERAHTRIARALDAVGWPAGDRLLDTSAYNVQAISFTQRNGISAKQVADEAAAAELGLLYLDGLGRIVFKKYNARSVDGYSTTSQCTLSDSPSAGELTYWDATPEYTRDRIYNDIYVEVATNASGGPEQTGVGGSLNSQGFVIGGVVLIKFGPPIPPVTLQSGSASDSGSQEEYGVRALQISTSTASTGLAQTLATELLRRYKDPHYRFAKVVLMPLAGDDPAWPHVLARDIGHRITVEWTPPGGSQQLSFACWIEGVHHKVVQPTGGAPAGWQTTWDLSPVI